MARRGRPPSPPKGSDLAELSDERELALAAEVARSYYLEDLSKVAIADALGLSRFQVARLLGLAKRSGIVHIEIGEPGGIDRELSALMQETFDLPRVIVVSSSTNVPLADIGRTLAELLAEKATQGQIIGLSWSRALRSMVEQLDGVAQCTFVQLAGHIGPPGESFGSVELVRRAAEATQGEACPIYAPFLVPDASAAASLTRQRDIAQALSYFDQLDIAMISIGAWAPSASMLYEAMTESERNRASELGVIGDINGRLFDASGQVIDEITHDRVIGLTLDQLEQVPEVICSSHGAYRAQATLTALRARLATTFVIDQSLARAILDLL